MALVNLSWLVACLMLVRTTISLPRSCTPEYQDLAESTMCKYYANPGAKNQGISGSERQVIMDLHNKYRSGVSPPASDMVKMYWDDEIAKIAQHYADSCPNGHDTNKERMVPGYGISIGQNLAWNSGEKNWETKAITPWYDEVEDFTYGGPQRGVVGHYTQVVRNHAIRIGCGYAECPTAMPHTYVCNYAYGQMDLNKPYTSGASCSSCSSHCSNQLCDCGDTLCYNGGTLNLDTCSCDCVSPYTSRSNCQDTDCPASDSGDCDMFSASDCDLYFNVPTDCPWLCGLCTEAGPGTSGGSSHSSESDGMQGDESSRPKPSDQGGNKPQPRPDNNGGNRKPDTGGRRPGPGGPSGGYSNRGCSTSVQTGDGIGGQEEFLTSAESFDECVSIVTSVRPDANGVTFQPGSGACYAEFGQTSTNVNPRYENCYI